MVSLHSNRTLSKTLALPGIGFTEVLPCGAFYMDGFWGSKLRPSQCMTGTLTMSLLPGLENSNITGRWRVGEVKHHVQREAARAAATKPLEQKYPNSCPRWSGPQLPSTVRVSSWRKNGGRELTMPGPPKETNPSILQWWGTNQTLGKHVFFRHQLHHDVMKLALLKAKDTRWTIFQSGVFLI